MGYNYYGFRQTKPKELSRIHIRLAHLYLGKNVVTSKRKEKTF